MKVICGDANRKGNIYLTSKGGCRKELDIENAYRCTGCGVFFHRDCIFEHFELEKDHSNSHNALRILKDYCKDKKTIKASIINNFIEYGLNREFQKPEKFI